jgi:hypothetical protein
VSGFSSVALDNILAGLFAIARFLSAIGTIIYDIYLAVADPINAAVENCCLHT